MKKPDRPVFVPLEPRTPSGRRRRRRGHRSPSTRMPLGPALMPFVIVAMLLLAIGWVFVETGGPKSEEELQEEAESERKRDVRDEKKMRNRYGERGFL